MIGGNKIAGITALAPPPYLTTLSLAVGAIVFYRFQAIPELLTSFLLYIKTEHWA
jgi:hypothetical protein